MANLASVPCSGCVHEQVWVSWVLIIIVQECVCVCVCMWLAAVYSYCAHSCMNTVVGLFSLFFSLPVYMIVCVCVCVCLYKATVTFHWWSIMGNWSTICFCPTRQSWRSLYITWHSSYIHEVTYCVCAVYWLAISPCVCHCSSIPPPQG